MRRSLFTLVVGALMVPAASAHPEDEAAPATVRPYAPLLQAVSSFGAVSVDGYLYVYGGHAGTAHLYSTETVSGSFRRLNLADGISWEELPGGTGLQGLALVAHGGKVYRVGGMQPRNKPGQPSDTHSVTECSCYDPATRKWTPLPDLPAGRSSHDAAVVGDKLIVAGGWDMRGTGEEPVWHTTAVVLDLKDPKKWESVKQPFKRRALTMAAHDGKAYVIGGMTEKGDMTLGVDIYDPAKDAWTKGPDIPGPKGNGFSAAACEHNGRLCLSTADGVVHRLNEKEDGWERLATLTFPRMVHRIVPAGWDVILVVGGASSTGNVRVIEAVRFSLKGKEKGPFVTHYALPYSGPMEDLVLIPRQDSLTVLGGVKGAGLKLQLRRPPMLNYGEQQRKDKPETGACRIHLGSLSVRPLDSLPIRLNGPQAVIADKNGKSAVVISSQLPLTALRLDLGRGEGEKVPITLKPEPRTDFTLLEYNGELWMIGGRDEKGKDTLEILAAKPDTLTFEPTKHKLPRGHVGSPAVILNGRLYVLREQLEQGKREMDVLNLETGEWTTAVGPSVPGLGLSLVAFRDALYVTGADHLGDPNKKVAPSAWVQMFSPNSPEKGWKKVAAGLPDDEGWLIVLPHRLVRVSLDRIPVGPEEKADTVRFSVIQMDPNPTLPMVLP